MSELACLYLALAARAAGRKVGSPLLRELLGVLGASCREEFLEAVALLLAPPAAAVPPELLAAAGGAGAAGSPPAAEMAEPLAAVEAAEPPAAAEADPMTALPPLRLEGRYLYGVVGLGGAASAGPSEGYGPGGDGPGDGEGCRVAQDSPPPLGVAGVDGNPVYLVRDGELGALVHACPPQPYESDDPQRATAWLEAHHAVLEAAMARWGGVIPATFDTVLKGTGPDPDAAVRGWLGDRHVHLCQTWQRIAGKAEYGVEITWDAGAAEREARAASPDIARLEGELASMPPGLAYLHRRQLEQAMSEAVGDAAEAHCNRLLEAIRPRCSEVRVEEAARVGQGRHLVLKAACLAGPGEAERLGEALDEAARTPGLEVRFTGPWPPFSFVE